MVDDTTKFSVMFTSAVIDWNRAENAARSILMSLAGPGIGVLAAVSHLGNVAIKDALNSVADALRGDGFPRNNEMSDHVCHFVEGMDILRVYRNFYVHSLIAVGELEEDDSQIGGLLHTVEARGKIAWITQDLTLSELKSFADKSIELSNYGDAIAKVLAEVSGRSNEFGVATPLSLLQKPTWPEKLKKNRSHLGGR